MESIALMFILSFCASMVHGWGSSGHQTIGYVAMPFLAPNALAFVKSSLGSTYDQSLGPAATWADQIRSNPSYAWASQLHFVDAKDSPPTSCSVSESRDCASGKCILTAISNYTSRVVDTGLSTAQRQEALKFLDHFIGDIGQPLHVEAFKTGGNSINVQCSGLTSNLHAVWDSGIIDKLLPANYSNSVTTWADALTLRIKNGTYADSAASWISCHSTTTPARRSFEDDASIFLLPPITPLECPLEWAQDSNKLDCSFVFSYTNGLDLCTSSYYTNAVPIIETQIAKQGYRLAAWLNVLFDGSTKLP